MEQNRSRGRASVQPRNFSPVRPQVNKDVTEGMRNLTSEFECVPVGRGAIRRSQREIEYYRSPRPESSMASKEGTFGRKIQLVSNYFPITNYTNWNIHQYRVDFNPEQEKKVIQRSLVHIHSSKLGPYMFDGTMLFSSEKYEDKFELVSKRNFDDQIVIITISYVNTIKTGDYANVQVFNIIMNNCIRHLNLQQIGRPFYDLQARIYVEKHRLQILPGYETTINMFDSGLMLRAEIKTKIMRKDTALDFFIECIKNGGMNKFKEGIIGTIIFTPYNNKTYRIHDVDDKAMVTSTFSKKDGTNISFAQYFKEKWNLTIRESRQPMLVSKKKNTLGTLDQNVDEQLIYLVPEFCLMTGLTDNMRSNFALMKDIASYTQVNPSERINRYNNFMKRLHTTPSCLDVFKTWNLTLNTTLVEVTGRVLPPETIQCNNVKKIDGGTQGDWTNNLRNAPMFASATIKQWYLICPPRLPVHVVKEFVNSLRHVASKMNFMLPVPDVITVPLDNTKTYLDEVNKVCNAYNPPFIMCILSNQRGDLYITLKKTLCVAKAIPSQVVLQKNVEKKNLSVITKIAIQINSKLGGAPWRVVIPSQGMMIVGFDVCHDKKRNKSYGALLSTTNDTHTSFYSNVQAHNSGEEISNHFGALIVAAVQKYMDKNNYFPTKIVIYRDGVGDGQLSYVEKTEVKSIKVMCQQAFGQVPSLAFIIVKKRISTKFFSKSTQGMQNPPPGTIVDSKVTDPTMYDFYLVSQNSHFGTVVPTHYNIIEDTLPNWSPDKMQRLTFKLCHMFYNWSGTTRVPAPCQLAHKLAFLACQVGVPNAGLDELLYFL